MALPRRTLLRAGLALAALPVGSAAAGTKRSQQNPRDGAVTGTYTSLYAYDASGDWYWDLGDGRVRGSVDSVDDLDQDTLTVCDYKVQYRGDFGDDPFLDDGWIMNEIRCHGYAYDRSQTFKYLIVHETDPRYRGIEDRSIWGTWEYHVDVEGGFGNKLARPATPPGQRS